MNLFTVHQKHNIINQLYFNFLKKKSKTEKDQGTVV